jgi:predicted nucleic acid-binding Zn ribbon protein
MTDPSIQEVQVCVVLEKYVAEMCTGVGKLVQEMGSLLVLDCASCSARNRRSDPRAQVGD